MKHSWLTCQIFLKSGEAEFIKVFLPHPYQIQGSHTHIFPSFSAVISSRHCSQSTFTSFYWSAKGLPCLHNNSHFSCRSSQLACWFLNYHNVSILHQLFYLYYFKTGNSHPAFHCKIWMVSELLVSSCSRFHSQHLFRISPAKNLLTTLKSSFITILLFSGHFSFPLSFQTTEPH